MNKIYLYVLSVFCSSCENIIVEASETNLAACGRDELHGAELIESPHEKENRVRVMGFTSWLMAHGRFW